VSSGAIVGLALCEAENTVWLATETGLLRWRGGKLDTPQELGAAGPARCVYLDHAQRLIAGMTDRGLAVVNGGQVRFLGESQGLTLPHINQLVEDNDHNLWLGTVNGIARLEATNFEAALINPQVHLTPRLFNDASGLSSGSCTWGGSPSSVKLPDGRLVFPTADGVCLIDPATPLLSAPPPTASIRTVEVDGARFAPSAAGQRKPVTATRPLLLRVEYDAVALEQLGGIEFRYCLGPEEGEWTSLGAQRTLTLLRPPPGEHNLFLQVRGDDGRWYSAPPLGITILPYWWQRWPARASFLVAVAGIPILLVRRYYRQRERTHLMAEESALRVRAERARIARDLHDDLGNRLSEMQFLAERMEAGETAESGGTLLAERLRKRSIRATEALDQLVWLLNPKHDTLASLVRMMERESSDYLETAGVCSGFEGPRILPDQPLDARTRHDVLCSLREMLRNAVRHGKPTQVTVRITVDNGLKLTVEDDGAGFDWPAAKAEGRGVSGLEARAREHGGSMEVRSVPGKTSVSLFFPFQQNGA
jgi:signal transduction histidine kinase